MSNSERLSRESLRMLTKILQNYPDIWPVLKNNEKLSKKELAKIVTLLESVRHRRYHSSRIRENIEWLVSKYTRELRREQNETEKNNFKTVYISNWELFYHLKFLGELDSRGKLRVHRPKKDSKDLSAAASSSSSSSQDSSTDSKECKKSQKNANKKCNSKILTTSAKRPKEEKEKILPKWNTEKFLFLIEQYRKKRTFWCRNEDEYISDTKKRSEVLFLLTSQLNAKFQEKFTQIQVGKQINMMRQRFFTLSGKFGGEVQRGEIQQPKWELYKPLQFLANQKLRSQQSALSTTSSRKRRHSVVAGPRPLLASKSFLFNEQNVKQASNVEKKGPAKIRRCSSDPCTSVYSFSAKQNHDNVVACNIPAPALEVSEDEVVDVETVDSDEEGQSQNSNLLAKTTKQISKTNIVDPTSQINAASSNVLSNATSMLQSHSTDLSTQESNKRSDREIELIDLTLSDDEEYLDKKDLKYSSTLSVNNSDRRQHENKAMCTELATTVIDRLIYLAASDQSKVKEKMDIIKNILYAAEFN